MIGMCDACNHHALDHSQILDDAPCLDCDCPTFFRRSLPSPAIVEGWHCPICGKGIEGYGTERRRVGRRPWKRRVHTACVPPVLV